MSSNHSLWLYFVNADILVQAVMVLLLCASVLSWTIIFHKIVLYKKIKQAMREFDRSFWSGTQLTKLYRDIMEADNYGTAILFQAGFTEFVKRQKSGNQQPQDIIDGVERAMRIANVNETEKLERHLSLLASIGSTAPYIGLFGTVWGIMTALQSLGHVQHATLSAVAPGVSEALLATALGLFAAIPAVLAFNRFNTDVDKCIQDMDNFKDHFTNLLTRQIKATIRSE